MDDREVARMWDANAETWTRHVRKGYDTYRDLFNNPAFLKFVGDLSGLDVLDVGCGEGYNTRLLAEKGARMMGADISPEMIRFAREAEQAEPRDPLRGRLGVGHARVRRRHLRCRRLIHGPHGLRGL